MNAASAEALLLAQRGELERAEALARTAVATAETNTDSVWLQANTHEDLATVLERAGRIDEAREALERALAILGAEGLPALRATHPHTDRFARARAGLTTTRRDVRARSRKSSPCLVAASPAHHA